MLPNGGIWHRYPVLFACLFLFFYRNLAGTRPEFRFRGVMYLSAAEGFEERCYIV
jgi:hypothetical protein